MEMMAPEIRPKVQTVFFIAGIPLEVESSCEPTTVSPAMPIFRVTRTGDFTAKLQKTDHPRISGTVELARPLKPLTRR